MDCKKLGVRQSTRYVCDVGKEGDEVVTRWGTTVASTRGGGEGGRLGHVVKPQDKHTRKEQRHGQTNKRERSKQEEDKEEDTPLVPCK